MFRITPPQSDSATESLITRVGTKWDYVTDSSDLKGKLQAALGDEIVRAWRAAGRPTKPAILDTLSARSRSRCIDRWLAAGILDEIAEGLADDPSIGLLQVPIFASHRFAILRAGRTDQGGAHMAYTTGVCIPSLNASSAPPACNRTSTRRSRRTRRPQTRGFAHDLGGEGDRSTATGASTRLSAVRCRDKRPSCSTLSYHTTH